MGVRNQNNKTIITDPDYYYRKYLITNCGKGSAINVQCRLYKVGKARNDNLDVTSKPFTVSIQKHFDLGLYLHIGQDLDGKYKLVITYQDIFLNKYKQTILFNINKDSYFVDLSQYHVQVRS